MFVLRAGRGSRERLLAAMLFAAVLEACGPLRFDELPDGGDASVSADASQESDANASTGPDATSDSGSAEDLDGGGVDASEDVMVVASFAGLDLGGLPVLVHDSAGELIASFITNGEGVVTVPYVEDGYVTLVFMAEPGFAQLNTIAMWAPGSIAAFDFFAAGRGFPLATVRVPPMEPAEGAVGYGVSFGCEHAESSTTGPAREVELLRGCLNSENEVRGLATAVDATGRLVAYEWSRPFVPTSTTVRDVRFEGHWSPPSRSCRLDGTSVPAGVTSVSFECDPVVDGVVYSLPKATALVQAGESVALELAGTSDARFRATTALLYGSAVEDSSTRLVEHLPYQPTSTTALARDLASGLLPRVSSAALATVGAPRLLWTLERPLREGEVDVILVTVGSEHSVWSFMLPSDTPSPFRVPDLPEILAQYAPTREEALVQLLDADEFGNYDELADRHGMVGFMAAYLSVPPLTRGRSSNFGGLTYKF